MGGEPRLVQAAGCAVDDEHRPGAPQPQDAGPGGELAAVEQRETELAGCQPQHAGDIDAQRCVRRDFDGHGPRTRPRGQRAIGGEHQSTGCDRDNCAKRSSEQREADAAPMP